MQLVIVIQNPEHNITQRLAALLPSRSRSLVGFNNGRCGPLPGTAAGRQNCGLSSHCLHGSGARVARTVIIIIGN